jgi:hypothetical protein
MSASKFDREPGKEKVDLSLIPLVAEQAIARAMMYGEKKYGRYNYCKGHEASQLVAAARRHLAAWFNGEENDPESGVNHLGHAMANCLMILRQQELGTLKDNRYKAPPTTLYSIDEKTGDAEPIILAHYDGIPYYPGSEGMLSKVVKK